MKRIILFIIFALLFSIINAQNDGIDRPNLSNPNSFSLILLGDPQSYVKYERNQPIFDLCTAWIADNINRLKIRATLITGDLVEQNEYLAVDSTRGDQTSKQQWEWESHCLGRLDGRIPYIISPGNHEYGYTSGNYPFSHFSDYFSVERNIKVKECIVSTFPNRMGHITLENSAYKFSDKNWGNILIITTEFMPRDEVLEWAGKLCNGEKYKSYTVFFMTHSFLFQKTANRTTQGCDHLLLQGNCGENIWNKLIYPCSNIRFVISGHTGVPGPFEENVAYRKDKNSGGKIVHQMMFNVQTLGGGWQGNGGDGWLRILEFFPDGKTVKVRTYSPFFGISPTTKQFAYRNTAIDQFYMVIE